MTYYPTIAKLHFTGGGLNLKVALRAKYIDVDRFMCDKCKLAVSKSRLEAHWSRKMWRSDISTTEAIVMMKDAAKNNRCPQCNDAMHITTQQIIKISTTNMPHNYINTAMLLRVATFFGFTEKSTKFCRNEVAAYVEDITDLQKRLGDTIKNQIKMGRIRCAIQVFPVDDARLQKDYKDYYARKVVRAL